MKIDLNELAGGQFIGYTDIVFEELCLYINKDAKDYEINFGVYNGSLEYTIKEMV